MFSLLCTGTLAWTSVLYVRYIEWPYFGSGVRAWPALTSGRLLSLHLDQSYAFPEIQAGSS
jgi:hypothetical protein